MIRKAILFISLCLLGSVAAERPLGPQAIVDGDGADKVVLDRYDDPLPKRYTVVFIDAPGNMLSEEQVGQAVNRLLVRSIHRRPFPQDFTVQFGGVRARFEEELQRRLRQPNANWNLSTSKPRNGDYYTILRGTLASVIAASPIAAAFQRNGYTLRLDNIARVTEDTTRLRGRHMPSHVDEMSITAHRFIR